MDEMFLWCDWDGVRHESYKGLILRVGTETYRYNSNSEDTWADQFDLDYRRVMNYIKTMGNPQNLIISPSVEQYRLSVNDVVSYFGEIPPVCDHCGRKMSQHILKPNTWVCKCVQESCEHRLVNAGVDHHVCEYCSIVVDVDHT